jgi:hypothetical protein
MFEFFRLLSAEDGLRFIVFDCRLPHMAAQQSQGSRPQDAPTNVVSGGRVFWLHAETIQMLRSISWGALEPLTEVIPLNRESRTPWWYSWWVCRMVRACISSVVRDVRSGFRVLPDGSGDTPGTLW